MNVLRPVGAIARYATFGGASIAAYDCAVGDGSMVSHIIKQLVASAASSRAPEFPTLALAPAAVDHAMRLHGQELAELSAKLDVLTRVSLSHLAGRGGASRVPIGTLLCAAGVVFGGLAAWAIATGRWWPTVNAKLEGIEQSISVVDAKIDMRAAELAAQLVDQHQQVLSALSCVSANVDDKVGAVDLKVGAIETKLDRLERRIVEMDDMERENNRGIHILCEVVAKNFDLRDCPAPVLKRLHDFSGFSTELVAAAPRVLEPSVQRQPSALMQYLTSPSSDLNGRATC